MGLKILTTFECVNAEEIRGVGGTVHRARYRTSVVVYYAGNLINPCKRLRHRGRRVEGGGIIQLNLRVSTIFLL